MPELTIRNIDEELMRKLKERAARHGGTPEEEAREMLRCALAQKAVAGTQAATENLWDALRRAVEPLGGVDLEIPPREPPRKPRLPTRAELRWGAACEDRPG